MKELKEIRFENGQIFLDSNIVKGAILPKKIDELDQDVIIQKDTVVEGAVYANRLEIKNGDVDIRGAAFAQLEIHVNSDAAGSVKFRRSIGAVGSVVSHAKNCKLMILSDINAKEVRLENAFVAGSIFADEISLTNCVVIGGVFATSDLSIKSSIVGTFNSPTVTLDGDIFLLLPSAFSLEPASYNPATTTMTNLCLADLGSLYRHMPQLPNSGKIRMNLDVDELKSTLSTDNRQLNLRSYTIIGKVLAADLMDWDKMQNHFLLTAASLNSQLLKTYDLGLDADGNKAELTPERISEFFFDLLGGKIPVSEIDGSFSIDSVRESFA